MFFSRHSGVYIFRVQVYYYVCLLNLVILASICQIIRLQETQKLIKI